VLARPGALEASDIAEQLDDLALLCGEGLTLTPDLRAVTAKVAVEDRLTFYDAAYVAVSRSQRLDLVTADRGLLAAGGESPADYAARMGF